MQILPHKTRQQVFTATSRIVFETILKGWLILTVVFLAGRWLPGDPTAALLGPGLNTPKSVAALKHTYGLDRPLFSQYLGFCRNLLKGDMGISFHTGNTVASEIRPRIGVTATLGGTAFGLALLIGMPLGFWLAYRQGTRVDSLITTVLGFMTSLPVFLTGLTLLYVVCYKLSWFTILPSASLTSWFLPVLALTLPILGFIGRTIRQTALVTLRRLNVLALHGFGLGVRTIWLHHLLPNAAPQCFSACSMALAYALAGNVFIETIFSCAGLGQLVTQSVLARDYPVLQATVLLIAITFLALNLVADLAATLSDPRQVAR
jgi:peptide/nickel transport system permease protein